MFNRKFRDVPALNILPNIKSTISRDEYFLGNTVFINPDDSYIDRTSFQHLLVVCNIIQIDQAQ